MSSLFVCMYLHDILIAWWLQSPEKGLKLSGMGVTDDS